MLLFGFQARFAAFGLAIFSIITAFIFHSADDQAQHQLYEKSGHVRWPVLFNAAWRRPFEP
jgi:uncharacterized membrane protein YphA (DoxX/SURF4 family)